MTKTPKLQAGSIRPHLNTVFTGIKKFSVFMGRWDLGEVWTEVRHTSGIGCQHTSVVDAALSLLFKPGIFTVG